MAEFMRFYGSTFRDVVDMPSNWFFKLYGYIEHIRAAEKLSMIPIYSWSYMKEHSQRQMNQQLKRLVKSPLVEDPETQHKRDQHSYDQAWGALRGMGLPTGFRNGAGPQVSEESK